MDEHKGKDNSKVGTIVGEGSIQNMGRRKTMEETKK